MGERNRSRRTSFGSAAAAVKFESALQGALTVSYTHLSRRGEKTGGQQGDMDQHRGGERSQGGQSGESSHRGSSK